MPGTTITIEPDERGESEAYEAFSIVCRDDATGRVCWTEGVRKDRSAMYDAWREWLEPVLAAAKATGGAK